MIIRQILIISTKKCLKRICTTFDNMLFCMDSYIYMPEFPNLIQQIRRDLDFDPLLLMRPIFICRSLRGKYDKIVGSWYNNVL